MAQVKGKALVILAEGAEEMEAVITADVLRRGKVSKYALFLMYITKFLLSVIHDMLARPKYQILFYFRFLFYLYR